MVTYGHTPRGHRVNMVNVVKVVMSDNYYSPATTINTPHLDPAGDN